MLRRAVQCVLLGVAAFSLAGCGPVVDYGALQPEALEGNWNLVGDSRADVPVGLSVGLAVSGSQVSGQGFLETTCGSGGGLIGAAGGNFAVSGQIAADGTFVLELFNPGPVNGNTMEIRGHVPAAGSAGWSGSYSFAKPGTTCGTGASGSFTATRMGPLHDAPFAGTLAQANVTGKSVGLTLDLSEGKTASAPHAGGTYYYLPLTGTLSVSGTSCFTAGTVTANPLSMIGGYFVTLDAQMNDGSRVLVNGIADDVTEGKFHAVLMSVLSGPCAGQAFEGTLSRQ